MICPLCTGYRIIYLGRESNPRTCFFLSFRCHHYWRICFFFFLFLFSLWPLVAYFFVFFCCHHYWRICLVFSFFTVTTTGVFFCIFFFHMIHNNTIYMHIIIFTKPPRIKHAYNQALQISLHGNIIQVTETSALMHARERHVL